MASVWFWTGTDASTTTNYNTQPDGSGSTGLPGAGDTLYITTPNTITAGLTALSAIALTNCIIPSNSVSQVTSGSALSVQATNLKYAGSGSLFSVTAATGITTCEVTTTGTFKLTGGTTTNLKAVSGTVNVDGAATVTNTYALGAAVTIASGAGTCTLLEASAGSVNSARTITTITLANSPQVTITGLSAATTVNISGGTFNFRSSGTVTTCNLRGGTLTPAGASSNPVITTLNTYGTDATTTYISQAGSVTIAAGSTNSYGFVTAQILDQPVA